MGLRVASDKLQVFHSRAGDNPERILLTTVDLIPDAARWQAPDAPSEILKLEVEWEGGDLSSSPSIDGAQTSVRQLRDPYVFEDADGSLYLFYSGKGEEGIGVAELK